MKANAEKNLKEIKTLANGNYAYKWDIDMYAELDSKMLE